MSFSRHWIKNNVTRRISALYKENPKRLRTGKFTPREKSKAGIFEAEVYEEKSMRGKGLNRRFA
jgi:hypothetical protein